MFLNPLYNLYKLINMPEWVSISLTEDEKNFLKEKLISPTKLFKWALRQKGFRGAYKKQPKN